MIWPFKRGIDVESGIVHFDGWFATGSSPEPGKPWAEIYGLNDPADPPEAWILLQQERLSRVVRWQDDYFQLWAEILAFGETGLWPTWVIIGFDASGRPVSAVDYIPLWLKGEWDDVSYRDSTAERLGGAVG